MGLAVASSTAQTPKQRTFGELKRFVADYVQAADYGEELSVAGRAINSAIDLLNTRPWHFNLKSDDMTLVAGTATYAVNADVKKPRKAQLLDASDKSIGFLRWRDPKTFWDEYRLQDQNGLVRAYTLIALPANSELTLNRAPDAAFVSQYPTLRLHYAARLNYLASDGDTLDGPPELWSFVGWYGRHDMALIQGATLGVVDRAANMWRQFWAELVKDDNDQEHDF